MTGITYTPESETLAIKNIELTDLDAQWVAVGFSATKASTILHSTDGSNWNSVNPGSAVFSGEGFGAGVAWNGSYWVAVGNSSNKASTILHSTDGSNWRSANPGSAVFSTSGYGVAWNGSNRWVAVGNSSNTTSTILHSTDGSNWNSANPGSAVFSGYGQGVAWNGSNQWVAVGDASDTTSTILHSTDGSNWNSANPGSAVFSVGIGVAGYTNIYTTTIRPSSIITANLTTQSLSVSTIQTVGHFNVGPISSTTVTTNLNQLWYNSTTFEFYFITS
jgi:hypothetical protein